MSEFWKSKRLVVTGGAGFLGSRIVKRLRDSGADVFVPRKRDYDLVKMDAAKRLFSEIQPEVVIHAAAVVGGIGANMKNPGRFFYENLLMGTQVMEAARLHGVKKLISIGTICCYPKYTSVPFKEEDIWNGYPEETNAPYGLAKKMLLVQGSAYRQQYNFNSIFLLPVNLYGPGDNFDPESSHVIPALIRKCFQSTGQLDVWGTGEATREFLYVQDCADAVVLAAERYNKPDPINIGTGTETKIKDLVKTIAKLTEFKGDIHWNSSKPDGQPRRCLDVTKAEREFGFRAMTRLEEGLVTTIDYYRKHML